MEGFLSSPALSPSGVYLVALMGASPPSFLARGGFRVNLLERLFRFKGQLRGRSGAASQSSILISVRLNGSLRVR